MSERLHQSPEQEHNTDAAHVTAHEHHDRIAEQVERRAELSKSIEANVDSARREALESAKKTEALESSKQEKPARAEKAPVVRKRTKKNLDTSFKKQMSDVQHDMPAPSRTFSKLIHTKGVEQASEAVGSTIARPNAILAGSMSAFILVLAIYLLARYVGYPLSGFEVIGSFIIGWLIGIIFDFMRIMITGKR